MNGKSVCFVSTLHSDSIVDLRVNNSLTTQCRVSETCYQYHAEVC